MDPSHCNKPILFGTKAETLARLRPIVRSAAILPLSQIEFVSWHTNRDRLLDEILCERWAEKDLIVRSSASGEDKLGSTQAGKFRTIKNVRGRDSLADAIDAVFGSYDSPTPSDHLLVQPQLTDVRASGVASSVDPTAGTPYLVVNWAEGDDTAAVTSGHGTHIRTWYGASSFAGARPPNASIASVTAVLRELRELTGFDNLQIEFAVRNDGSMVLFQARPLKVPPSRVTPTSHAAAIRDISKTISGAQLQYGAIGRHTAFGIMPDWNPAEMIGIRPRPLALSLYKSLITDRVWAEARLAYGYRDVRGIPLLVDFCGLPYIDVRASFMSLVPAALDNRLATRLVEYYVDRLIADPKLHDKIEFEIALTSYSPMLEQRLESLSSAGFSESEQIAIREALKALTNRLISKQGAWATDLERLRQLRKITTEMEADSPDAASGVIRLLDVCERYGTLPFAGLARAGFVAMEFLNGLVGLGLVSQEQKANLLASLRNVTSVLVEGFHRLSREEFLARYGHLRPGTYDILSPRYDELPNNYFDWSRRDYPKHRHLERFEVRASQRVAIDRLLHNIGMECDTKQLLQFISMAIKGREEAKFAFTWNISEALRKLRLLGEHFGFSADDMSFIDVDSVRALQQNQQDVRGLLARAVESGRERYELTRAIMLPPLIHDARSVWSFELPQTEPNYITQKRAVARVADLQQGQSPEEAIAFIESADPGYDWLFARRIAGLVTAYGGINSHMAIRALEFGVPAAIGVGHARFQTWRTATLLELDAENRCVRRLA